MAYPSSVPAKRPGIRQYLVARIVGVLAALLLLLGAVLWFAVVRPAQAERTGAEMELAAQQTAAAFTTFAANTENLLSAVREWERAGLLEPAAPEQVARLLAPLLQHRPAALRASWSDALGHRFTMERQPGGWLLRNLLPGPAAQEWQLRLDTAGLPAAEPQIAAQAGLPAALSAPLPAAGAQAGIRWGEARPGPVQGPPVIEAAVHWDSLEAGPAAFTLEVSLAALSRGMAWGRPGFLATLDPAQRLAGLQRGEEVPGAEAPPWLVPAADAGLAPLAAALAAGAGPASGQAAPAAFDHAGGRWVRLLQPMALGGRPWLIVGVADATHYPLIRPGQWWAIAAALLAFLVLASLAGTRTAGQLARVVEQLAERSARLGSLQLEPQPPLQTAVREVHQLIDAQEHMRVLLQDATQQLETRVQARTAELAEREAAQRLQRMADERALLLRHLQVGIAYTQGGRIVHANPKLAEFFGFEDAQQMTGLTLRDLVEDDAEYARLEARILPQLLAGRMFSGEWRARRRDGGHFDVHARAQPISQPTEQEPGSSIWMVDDITERKRALRDLEETALYNQVLFQESHWAILVLDPRTERVVDCNQSAVRILGHSRREEVVGQPLLAFSAPRQYDGTPSEEAAQALGRESQHLTSAMAFEWRHRRPDGREWDAIVHIQWLRIGGRKLLQFTLDDVTDARAARRRVAELNAFLQAMLDRMPNAVFYKGEDSRLLGCNRRFEEMFGVQRADFLGKRLDEMDFAPPDVLAALQREDEQLIAEAGQVRREMRLRFADGKPHYTLYSASGFRLPDGTPGGLVGAIVDVDPLRRAERALVEANAEQLAIFESASMGICLVQGSVIRRCNRRLEQIFGWAEGEMAGQSTRIWYASEAAFVQGRALVHARLGTPHHHRHDLHMQRKDGSMFWCRLSGSYIDAQEPQRGSVWMLEDVTDEIAAAEALREAKRLADEATRAKSMFLANMSHEIRTPLNSIIGMSYLTLRTQLDERQRDYVTKVHAAGTALLGIVNDLLDYSRADAGRLELERSAFRFDEVLDSVASQVAQKAYDKGLELFFDTARDVPQDLLGDPVRLGQVIANLVGNAVKFTEHGQIAVSARVRERGPETVLLQVAVRDTGIGMSAEQTAKLFQAFTQADGSNTRRHGGTGLGLTLCKRLVELMGGSIAVESAPGQGALFWFTVQLGLGTPAGAPQPWVPPGLFAGMQALVADDNDALREILAAQLADLGFEVQAADSGQHALDALLARAADRTRRSFDVLLVDWKMPGMDGIETTRRVRQAALPLHIVMATAYGGQQDMRRRAEEAGVDVFLVKPVSQSSLVDALVRAFVPPAGQAPAPAAAQAPAADAPQPLAGTRILVADDSEAELQQVCTLLRQAGAEVQAVRDGMQAVEVAGEQRRFDAILLDLQMPLLDGIGAATRLRADARLASVPLLGMAAEDAAEQRRQALAAGIIDHVAKPVEAGPLLQTLQRWLRPRVRRAPPATAPDAARLQAFAREQAGAGAQLAAALAAGDTAQAAERARALRGAAAGAGLAAVGEAARELEEALQAGADTGAALAYVRALLEQVLQMPLETPPEAPVQMPQASLERDQAPPPAPAGAQAAQAALTARMAALLAGGDAEAVDCLQAHAGMWRGLLGDAGFDRFARSLEDFDFDQALQQLQSAATATAAPAP